MWSLLFLHGKQRGMGQLCTKHKKRLLSCRLDMIRFPEDPEVDQFFFMSHTEPEPCGEIELQNRSNDMGWDKIYDAIERDKDEQLGVRVGQRILRSLYLGGTLQAQKVI